MERHNYLCLQHNNTVFKPSQAALNRYVNAEINMKMDLKWI